MRLFLGALFAIIGFLLLFGFFTGEIVLRIFHNFFTAWPIIFVFIGISILSGIKGLKWVRYINYALSIVFVLYLVFVPVANREDMFSGNFEIPVNEEYSSYDIQMDYAVINLEIKYHEKDFIDFQFKDNNSKPDFEINGNRIRIENTYFFATTNNSKIMVYLPEEVEYDFDLNSAIVNLDIEGESNYINDLKIDTAISNLKLESDFFPVVLDLETNTAISNIKIYSSKETTYDIDKEGPFISSKVDDIFINDNVNPEIKIDSDTAFGNIKLISSK